MAGRLGHHTCRSLLPTSGSACGGGRVAWLVTMAAQVGTEVWTDGLLAIGVVLATVAVGVSYTGLAFASAAAATAMSALLANANMQT